MSDQRRPRVKICGLTTAADAVRAVELGADYLGLNFYPSSPRYVGEDLARSIAAAVDGRCPLVGVFVQCSRACIERLVDRLRLDLLQFHGDEAAPVVEPFADRAIKVFRVDSDPDEIDLRGFEDCWAHMLDRRHPHLLGGTGESWNWELAAKLATERRLFVAGGITPDLARRAATASGAFALDVCSGIESAPGRKDWRLMERLFEELEDGG